MAQDAEGQMWFGTDANNYPSVSPDGRHVVLLLNGCGGKAQERAADGGPRWPSVRRHASR